MGTNNQLDKPKKFFIFRWFSNLLDSLKKKEKPPIFWDDETEARINAEFTNEVEQKEAKELLQELLLRNKDLLGTLDIKMLNKKYLDIFGKAKLERVLTDELLQRSLLELSDEELQVFKYILNYNVVDYNERITELRVFNNAGISLEQLESMNEPDREKFISILLSNSEFFLLDINEFKNYYEDRRNKCQSIIDNPGIVEEEYNKEMESEEEISSYPFGLLVEMKKLDYLDRTKYAIIEAKYGMNLEKAQLLCEAFGTDIDEIEQSEATRIIKDIKAILNETDIDRLKQISLDENKANYKGTINLISTLKNAYLKKYQETLYQVNDADYIGTQSVKIKGKENEVKIYNVLGKNNDRADFNMILTALGGIYIHHHDFSDFEADWNRADKNHTISCSFIGNDFLGVVCDECLLAFSDIGENELLRARYGDAATTDTPFERYEDLYRNTFLLPQNLKNITKGYNELLVERKIEKDGKLVNRRPTYAVFMAESIDDINDEENERWIYTKEMAAELNIPIAVIDVTQCTKLEYEKVEAMVKKVKEEKRMDLIPEIIHKIENNRAAQLAVVSKVRNEIFSDKNIAAFLESILGSIITSDTDKFNQGLDAFEKVTKEIRDYYSREEENEDNKDSFKECKTYDYDAYLKRIDILRCTRKDNKKEEPLAKDNEKTADKLPTDTDHNGETEL